MARLKKQLEELGLRLLHVERQREDAARGRVDAEDRRQEEKEAAGREVAQAEAAAASAEARAEAAGAALQEERRRAEEQVRWPSTF